jgi:hypothetical protein
MRPGKVAGGSFLTTRGRGCPLPQPQYSDTTQMCLTSEERGPIKPPVLRVSVSLFLQPQMVTGGRAGCSMTPSEDSVSQSLPVLSRRLGRLPAHFGGLPPQSELCSR